MLVDHFPLLRLRLRTPRLELRLPSSQELAALAEVAAEGIHDPDVMPFLVPWTDRQPDEVARSVIQYHWLTLGSWSPRDWSLNLTVFRGGDVVGQQAVSCGNATAPSRSPSTGSRRACPCSESPPNDPFRRRSTRSDARRGPRVPVSGWCGVRAGTAGVKIFSWQRRQNVISDRFSGLN
jgi:hypothetical protein